MSARVKLEYGITFGKLYSSDWIETWITMTGEAEAAYNEAMKAEKPSFSDFPALVRALEDAADNLKYLAAADLRDGGDEYARSFHHKYDKVDQDEIDELVQKKDRHTLEFFGLTEMDEEELEDWTAWDIDWDDLPEYEAFYPGFVERSPFDEGYILSVHYADDPECSC